MKLKAYKYGPEKNSTNGGAIDVNVNIVNLENPRTRNGIVTKVNPVQRHVSS